MENEVRVEVLVNKARCSAVIAQTHDSVEVWTLDRCIDYAMAHATDIRKKVVEADNARHDRGAAMCSLSRASYTFW